MFTVSDACIFLSLVLFLLLSAWPLCLFLSHSTNGVLAFELGQQLLQLPLKRRLKTLHHHLNRAIYASLSSFHHYYPYILDAPYLVSVILIFVSKSCIHSNIKIITSIFTHIIQTLLSESTKVSHDI